MAKQDPQPYEYDFDGACAPGGVAHYAHAHTFSVGVFQWLPRASGKGLKRGKVVRRLKGFMRDPEEVYVRARTLCAELNTDLKRQGVLQ